MQQAGAAEVKAPGAPTLGAKDVSNLPEAQKLSYQTNTEPRGLCQYDFCRYWMFERKSEWQPIADGPDVEEQAKSKGAMFVTCHAIDGDPHQSPPPNRRGDMHLDFDHSNPAMAFDEMRTAVSHLEPAYGLSPDQIKLYLSGGKGGHIVIPSECIGLEPSPYLHLEQKRFACKLAADLELQTIDLSIYSGGKGRQFRLANVQRDNGRYKVPIMANELMGLSNPDLIELTNNPREEEETEEPALCEPLHDLFANYREQVASEQADVQDRKPMDPETAEKLQAEIPPCVKAILKLTNRPPKGSFNQICLNLASYFHAAGYDLSTALQNSQSFLDNYQDSTAYTTAEGRTRHFKEMFLYVSKNPAYQFDCSYVLGFGLPGNAFDCDHCNLGEVKTDILEETVNGFRLVHASEMPCNPPDFVISPYFESGTFACLFGDPGTGKTFMGLDIAGCIAKEMAWHEHKTQGGSVVYVAGEGLGGIGRRRRAWETRHQTSLTDAPLYFSTGPTSLCDINAVSQLTKAVDGIAQQDPPKMVIFDTLARNFGPGDENSTKDMSMVIQALDSLRLKYGCTVLLIHHTGHGDKSRARGAMALKGALDAEYRMEKDDQGVVRFSPIKMKEAELPPPMAFKIRSVGLGIYDDDEQEVNSAILDRVEYEPPAKAPQGGRGKWQKTALKAFDELEQGHRERLEKSGFDPDQARVSLASLRDACLNAGMPKQRWYETKKSLNNQGIIKIDMNHVVRC